MVLVSEASFMQSGTISVKSFIRLTKNYINYSLAGMLRSQDHIFGLGLGLIVVGLDLGLSLMKYRSRSHGSWSRGLLPWWMTIKLFSQ